MNTKALRQKVLDLAIHGKLVPQNPYDESAEVLLKKIREEKAEKIKKGELKSDKKDSFIFVGSDKRHYEQFADGTVKDIEDEIPFDVPEGWAWCRLNELADIARGGSPRPIENYITDSLDGINWIKIGDTATESKYIESAKEKIKPEGQKHSRFVHEGDFLLTNSMSFGRPYILKINGCIHDGWLVFANIKECVIKDYLYYALSSDYIYASFSMVAAGSTVKNLKSDTVKQVLFPLPPIKTQEKIVESIEESFSQIDILDNEKSELQTVIKQTKSKILDLAIHGKLVPQDPNDEPAEELLKRIATSDNRPYKKFEEEEPFEIPSNWSWCFLDDICSKIKRGKSPKYVDKSTIMAFAQKCNQKDGPTSLDKALYIDETTLKKYPEEEKMQFNDIVINSTGTGTLGRVGIFNCSIPNDVNAVYPDSHVTTVRILPEIDKLYCYYFIKNKQSYLETMGEGSTNQKELKPDTISSLCFPLPPYPEQKRIVFKIEELFSSLETIVSNLD